jgi:hypothetical protein
LDGAVPTFTSLYIFQHVHERLQQILTSNLQIFVPHLIHAPAALSNNFVSVLLVLNFQTPTHGFVPLMPMNLHIILCASSETLA